MARRSRVDIHHGALAHAGRRLYAYTQDAYTAIRLHASHDGANLGGTNINSNDNRSGHS